MQISTELPHAGVDAEREVARLVREFTWLIDQGKAERVHELFTPDGRLTGAGLDLHGREAIAKWGRERAETGATSRHLCARPRVAFAGPRQATAVTTMVAFRHDGDTPGPAVPAAVGDFEDEVELGADGCWRLASRHITLLFTGPSRR